METAQPSSVLVVGSSSPARAAIEMYRGLGYDVRTAAHAFQALATFAKRPVHVMVYERQLPGRSGEWLADQVGRYRPDVDVMVLPDTGPPPIPCRKPSDATVRHAPVSHSRHRERRNGERVRCEHGVDVRPGHAATMVDRSSGGARLRLNYRARPDALITLRGVDRAERRARVAWCTVVDLSAEIITYEAGVEWQSPAAENVPAERVATH